jgi:hypothetical protein|tara:strand:- start:467 stop:1102 length:636 start_codon:yes stop_codon:yes gene_type:complete
MDFIEQVYKSVDYDCFNLILDYVKINRETEYNKRLFHLCLEEILYSVSGPGRPETPDKYIISRFNLNKIYEPFHLGIKFLGENRRVQYHYDKDYYDGLDFLLNKCEVFAFVDFDDEDKFMMFGYELKDKQTKFRKSYEENGYDNEEDFRMNYNLDASCEFNYNDSFLTGGPLHEYLSYSGEGESYLELDFNKDEDEILWDLRNAKICQLLF